MYTIFVVGRCLLFVVFLTTTYMCGANTTLEPMDGNNNVTVTLPPTENGTINATDSGLIVTTVSSLSPGGNTSSATLPRDDDVRVTPTAPFVDTVATIGDVTSGPSGETTSAVRVTRGVTGEAYNEEESPDYDDDTDLCFDE